MMIHPEGPASPKVRTSSRMRSGAKTIPLTMRVEIAGRISAMTLFAQM